MAVLLAVTDLHAGYGRAEVLSGLSVRCKAPRLPYSAVHHAVHHLPLRRHSR